MDERRIHDDIFLRFVQESVEEAKMAVTSADAVTGTVFVQYEQLTGTKPTLRQGRTKEKRTW